MGGKRIEIGERIGDLTVLSCSERLPNGKYELTCLCHLCGNETKVLNMVLRRRSACYECTYKRVGDKNVKHGRLRRGAKEKLFGAWQSMHNRCYNSKMPSYRWYGAKGITVCQEWHDYETFKAWAMANGYAAGMTLDRKRSAEGYSPENCEYVTKSVNSKRMRKEYHFVKIDAPIGYRYDEPTYGDY